MHTSAQCKLLPNTSLSLLKSFLLPLPSPPPPTPQRQSLFWFCFEQVNLFQNFIYMELYSVCFFAFAFFSLSIIFLRVICTVAWINSMLLSIARLQPIDLALTRNALPDGERIGPSPLSLFLAPCTSLSSLGIRALDECTLGRQTACSPGPFQNVVSP